jgi:hypothetical protein
MTNQQKLEMPSRLKRVKYLTPERSSSEVLTSGALFQVALQSQHFSGFLRSFKIARQVRKFPAAL